MKDDQPVTKGDVRRTVVKVSVGFLAGGVMLSVLLFVLYILACANMPTGCH